MSLSRKVKNELARLSGEQSCCSAWELKAFLLRHGYYTISREKYCLSIYLDDLAVARRLYILLKQAGVKAPAITRQQNKHFGKTQLLVQVQGRQQVDSLLVYLNMFMTGPFLSLYQRQVALPANTCCKKAFLRGIFMAGGSISVSPRSGYHLEISCGEHEDALAYQKVLKQFNLNPLIRKRKGAYYIYFKNAEAVADFLRIVGAGSALLDLESGRVIKSMRNRVNRLVNFETANLEKTAVSAHRQLDQIKALDGLFGLNNLTPALKEAAFLRLSHPEASLKELGELSNPPVSKSGMNHRFRQLEKLLEINQKK